MGIQGLATRSISNSNGQHKQKPVIKYAIIRWVSGGIWLIGLRTITGPQYSSMKRVKISLDFNALYGEIWVDSLLCAADLVRENKITVILFLRLSAISLFPAA